MVSAATGQLEAFPEPGFDLASLRNTVLVMPSCNAIGFLGQLTLDVLIAHYGFAPVAHVEPTHLVPMVGTNAYGRGEIQTACQLYRNTTDPRFAPFTLMQIRSYVPKLRSKVFGYEMRHWIEKMGFASLVVLTGAEYFASDPYTTPLTHRVFPSSAAPAASASPAPLGQVVPDLAKKLEAAWPTLDQTYLSAEEAKKRDSPLLPPGAGTTQFLLDAEHGPAVTADALLLMAYTRDGNNTELARQMALAVSQLLLGEQKASALDVSIPSWENLYGETSDRLY
ncbi:hypothetical protein CXG81DRAFT_27151 [Caulochytrium protostelioides]|uniref:Proteasome assembly chaperone 2 n=1 Tax=Caulochytrium protostelioides TaxID=1555241 RepID=A0A4P9X4U5_9FUNG|nr:hypothetical protein CXG81DRAFT_27151 [Caulochytrium protostelioides]|eukprot:RKP00117.1 hypothetical protein CXG81DRAFT_27151 [Caulochytrium protostelioides]